VTARQQSLLVLTGAGALFIDAFLPWIGPNGHRTHGWVVPLVNTAALLALGAVLVEVARLAAAWTSRASLLVSWFLASAAGIMAVAALVNLRWGDITFGDFGEWCYGAWIGLALALLLLALSAYRLRGLS
jgi:hypothetical protein